MTNKEYIEKNNISFSKAMKMWNNKTSCINDWLNQEYQEHKFKVGDFVILKGDVTGIGLVVDVNNTLDGDGPFSPERAGGVPAGELIKMCFSGKYSKDEVYKKIVGKGGVVAYLGTNDLKSVIDKKNDGDEKCKLVYDAFIYQVAKEIGAMSTVLKGQVDAIILTGGIAYSPFVVDDLKKAIGWIAPVKVYPGEDELLALAQGGIRVLSGEEEAKEYK